ncbi:MAG: D-2-hydroxyacid dehydrogenase, partial [Thiothrix sp.]|nr:D-2-hydroxyacid dehydrogenase [Thiothrix sp.]HPE59025.1 D-2-hydroxyacid dehydrogenase [Thiolinea sp.]
MYRIVFLDRDTIGPGITLTHPDFPHEWIEYRHTAPQQVVERLQDANIVITNKVALRADMLAQLPRLAMIAVAATGYDVVDVNVTRERRIVVSNVRAYAANSVPEHTFALIFALRRSLVGYRQDVIRGEWQKSGQFCFFNHPIRELHGSTLGVIGAGTLGQAVGAMGRALGMRVLYAAHKGADTPGALYTPFAEVLAQADVLSLHTPLTPATRHLIAIPEFRLMQRQPLLINTSRGGLVNEHDLVTALDQGLISGAGFDVLSHEPPTADNPLLAVLERPDVIVTPHVAWASAEAMQTLWDQVIDNISAFVAGAPVNQVGQ